MNIPVGGGAGGADTPRRPMDASATATGIYSQMDLAPGTVLAGRFRLESILGIGGMGVVYRATDLTLDVPVALKLLRPELAQRADAFERFREELLLARQVSSPHVVRIHDLARHDQHWLISMDFVDGTSLDHRLDREGAFAVDDALQLTRQLAQGLAAAHAKGVVHRDLKPANVLLDKDGNAYISDFGVARSLASSGLTRSGAVVGTPDYLSPEQARGDHLDARSDVYSLGLILYEMLAGKLPFEGGTIAEVLAQRMLRTPPPITRVRPEVPDWVARLIDKLLRPQPAHRFQSASEVVAAIDAREVPRDWRPSRPVWWGLAALLALGIGLGGWWLQRDTTPAVAASPPLERLLVLPLEHDGDPALAPQVAALGDHLRDAFAMIPGFAVVDSERTDQALRQLDPVGASQRNITGLHSVAAARRILQPALVVQDGRWQVQAQLHGPGGSVMRLEGPAAADPAAAVRAWSAQPTTLRAFDLPPDTLVPTLPARADALAAYGAAMKARQQGLLDEALEHLRSATTLAPGYIAAWIAQAEVAQAIGELDTAIDAIDRALQLSDSGPQRRRSRLVAERALLDGDPAAAIAAWQAVLQATPDDTFAELQLARAHGSAGDFATAVEGLQVLTRRDANDPRAWFELGKFALLSGDAQRAVDDHLVRALVLYKRSRNVFGEAETVNALGIGYGRLGQTTDAAEQYRKAVELRRAVGNRRGVATSLRNLANVLALTGEFDEAAAYLEQARALQSELGDREGLAATDNEVGLLAEERGDYPAALAAFRRALQGWRQAGDAHGGAEALNNIGFAHFQLGAYDDAQVYWQQAAEAYGKLGARTGEIRTGQNLGLLASARGQWDGARALLEQSLASAQQQQMPEEAAVSHRNLAEMELLQGHLAASMQHLDQAGKLFEQRQDQRGIIDVGLLRAQAWLLARADAQAVEVMDSLRPALESAATEQRATAQLLRADLASHRGDRSEEARALREARQLATRSGVRLLQLQIALRQARAGSAEPGLDASIATLGHAGLRLDWLEWKMQQALAVDDATAALAAYREARALLRNGDFRSSWRLHQLAARAHAAQGNDAEAQRAQSRSSQARAVFREALPEALRSGFDGSDARSMATSAGGRPG